MRQDLDGCDGQPRATRMVRHAAGGVKPWAGPGEGRVMMRHLWSLLLALALTPLIYISAGVSAVKLAEARGLGVTAR